MSNTGVSLTPEQALDQLQALYDQSVKALRDAIRLFIDDRSLPSAEARAPRWSRDVLPSPRGGTFTTRPKATSSLGLASKLR